MPTTQVFAKLFNRNDAPPPSQLDKAVARCLLVIAASLGGTAPAPTKILHYSLEKRAKLYRARGTLKKICSTAHHAFADFSQLRRQEILINTWEDYRP